MFVILSIKSIQLKLCKNIDYLLHLVYYTLIVNSHRPELLHESQPDALQACHHLAVAHLLAAQVLLPVQHLRLVVEKIVDQPLDLVVEQLAVIA